MRLMALVISAGLLWPVSTFAQEDGSSSRNYLTGNKLYEICTSTSSDLCLGYVMGGFRRAEPEYLQTEQHILLTYQRHCSPRASRGYKVPARSSRHLALQWGERHRSSSCDGFPLQGAGSLSGS